MDWNGITYAFPIVDAIISVLALLLLKQAYKEFKTLTATEVAGQIKINMKLSTSELSFYEENGYLLLPNCLSSEEVDYLIQEYPNTIEEGSPRVIREDNDRYARFLPPHFTTDSYDKLSKLERLVQPSEQLIGNKVYVHQYKINTKKGLEGDWWEWHQDFRIGILKME